MKKYSLIAMVFSCAFVCYADTARSPSDYVQDGLVVMFDGICNDGVGKPHNPAATVWKELSGKSSDGEITLKSGSWQEGSFIRTGPTGREPGGMNGTTSTLMYSLPQSFIDNLNAGGAFTIEYLFRKVMDSAGPGQLFDLSEDKLAISTAGDKLTYFAKEVPFGTHSEPTNTLQFVYEGDALFKRVANGSVIKPIVWDSVKFASRNASDSSVRAFTKSSGWGSVLDVYAIRIYDRALTHYEMQKNARTDAERFFGSNTTHVVEVKGFYANPAPTNGVSRVEPGTFGEVASDIAEIRDGERMVLTGWTWTPEGGSQVSGSGTKMTEPISADGVLEWHWKRQFKIDTSVTQGMGSVSEGGWYDEGATVEVAVTPADDAFLLGWTGKLEEETDRLSATITVVADKPRTIKANLAAKFSGAPEEKRFAFPEQGDQNEFNWSDSSIWGGMLPQAGDEIVIEGSSSRKPIIVIDAPLPIFKSVFVKNATVKFADWNVPLRTTGDITLSDNGVLTSTSMTYDDQGTPSRVWVVCENFSVQGSGAAVDVSGMGYQGKDGSVAFIPENISGYVSSCVGATYGGLGGAGYGHSTVKPFGSVEHPRHLGLAGSTGITNIKGGNGGGAVLIQSRGSVTVAKNNSIKANATDGSGFNNRGGGSGGSIEIQCETILGEGTISANGSTVYGWGGSGGGGRIAIHCDCEKQSALGYSLLNFRVRPGVGFDGYCFLGNCIRAEHGTLYLSEPTLINTNVNISAQVYLPGASLNVPALNIGNACRLEFPQDGFKLNVAGDVVLKGASGLVLGGEIVQYFKDRFDDYKAPRCSRRIGGVNPVKAVIGGNLTMEGKYSEIVLYPTSCGEALDAKGNPNGAHLQVGRCLTMMDGAQIIPLSCGTNGISCSIKARSLYMYTNAVFNAKGRGFFGGVGANYERLPGQTAIGYTPAKYINTSKKVGGSHGGLGGIAYSTFDNEDALYGNADHPVLPGAGGNSPSWDSFTGYGGHGGGLIHLEVEKDAVIHGTFDATSLRGFEVPNEGHTSSAAGGAIYLKTRKLYFSESAKLLANACDLVATESGAGGGGRIAIWRVYDMPGSVDVDTLKTDICNVAGGVNTRSTDRARDGKPGTLVLEQLPRPGFQFIVK